MNAPKSACVFRAIVAGLSMTLATQAVAQTPAPTPKDKPIPINIAVPLSSLWPAYMARDLKLFEQVGLSPTFYQFNTGAPMIAGMKSGSLDVAWTGLANLFMVGNSVPLRMILYFQDQSSQLALVVDPKSGITSYKDIAKAKNIGAPTATCSEVSLVLAAKAAGVQRTALRTSNLSPNLLLGALQNGQIDATFIWGPWYLPMRDAGYKIVNWDKDYMPTNGGVCAGTVAVRAEFLAAHPSVGCKLIKVQALALQAGRKDPEHAVRTLQEALNITNKHARELYETLYIPSIESQLDPNSPWSLSNKDGGLAEKLYVASEALYEAGAFRTPIPKALIQQSVDAKYIKEYLETDCK